MSKLLLVLFLTFFSSISLALDEIYLQAEQERFLFASDSVDIKIKNGVAWILKKQSLWRWDLQRHKLGKIDLQKYKVNFKHLHIQKANIWLSSDRGLFRLKKDEKLKLYPAKGKSLGIYGQEQVYWLSSQGIYGFKGKAFKLLKKASLGKLSIMDPKSLEYWSVSGSWLKSSHHKKMILNPRTQAIGLEKLGQDIVVYSPRQVVVVNANSLRVKKLIPVKGARQLLQADVQAKVHAYIFDDRLEIYPEKYAYELILAPETKVGILTVSKPFVAVMIDARPRIFKL